MVRIPTRGPPTHPGEMLLEEFLRPLRLTQRELAARLGDSCPDRHMGSSIRQRRAPRLLSTLQVQATSERDVPYSGGSPAGGSARLNVS